jgi:hypothetical protein
MPRPTAEFFLKKAAQIKKMAQATADPEASRVLRDLAREMEEKAAAILTPKPSPGFRFPRDAAN